MTKPWAKYESTINDLYNVQKKTLEETKNIMKTQYGFQASTRAYRAKIKKLGWTKYNKQKRSDHHPQTTSPGVASPHRAPLMTPGPSSEGVSAIRGPTTTRVTNSPNATYNFHSPDVGYPPRQLDGYHGVSDLSVSTSFASEHPSYQINPRNSFQFMRQSFPNPQFLASPPPQRNSGLPRWQAYEEQPQQQQAAPQQQMLFRPILPAVHQNGQHQNLHLDTGESRSSTRPSGFYPLQTVESPASSSRSPHQANHFNMNTINQFPNSDRLNEYLVDGNGQCLESFVQNAAAQGLIGSHASPQEIREFCEQCATFVQLGHDTTRIVPHNFGDTIGIALDSSDPAEMIRDVVLSHQRQIHQQHGVALAFPPWVSVWISACQQGLTGDSVGLDEHFDVLSRCFGSQFEVCRYLKRLIPRPSSPEQPYSTPESASNQLYMHDM